MCFAYKSELDQFATYDGEEHPAHKLLLVDQFATYDEDAFKLKAV
jgi:hypothetical protein